MSVDSPPQETSSNGAPPIPLPPASLLSSQSDFFDDRTGRKGHHHRSKKNKADHTATVPNLPAEMPEPSGTPDWLCTPKSPPVIYRSYIYDKKNHPNSPEFHHLLQQGLEIFEHISPEASSQDNPRPTPSHQLSDEERHLAAELIKCPSVPALSILAPLPQTQWDLFFSTLKGNNEALHITPSKFDFSNNFLLEIASPQTWVTTFHMEILMYMLAERHRELLQREQLAFTTPFLASGIQEIWKRFKLIRRKDRFQWDKRLTELVLKPGQKWMEDVITIYTPMCWGEKHWVGLSINLDLGCVEILDPLPSLYSDKKVVKFMEGVLTSLPYLVKKVAKHQQTQFRGLKPFYWKRMEDIYINERSGDCGPVSIKFMELHANGDPAPHMSGITDHAVDDLRKQYAMDIYKTIVIPAYHTLTFP
ncbi:hypothetical protein Bca52824_033976 [Brassica carinata]|uniref:Ubiquitin-like protease family profile domain-containing protein n=1 Tax=Brassica carinata TaxID=52824 RepID=A0A8X7V6K9_BRACI|nr:hypothetical protein Bca52824_033976 [Brassica carinata]